MESSGGQNSLEPQPMSSNEEVVEFGGDNDYYNFEINSLSSLPFVKTSQSIQWKNKVNLVGDKIINPKIHICDECNKPILVYGRMIPCKHVFCYECAKKYPDKCLRCSEDIMKIERCDLGTVYLCRITGCRRTYLSQRDLEAHIKHRHIRKSDTLTRL